MRGLIAVVLSCTVALGCGKKAGHAGAGGGKTTATGSARAGTSAASAARPPVAAVVRDPWGTPPADTNTDLGASTGGRLAKVDPKPAPPPQTDAKVDVTKIAQPSAPSVDVKGFVTKDGGHTDEVPPGFSVTYNTSPNEAHEEYRQSMVDNKVFDKIAEGLNKTVRLPKNIAIETVDCNTINAFYDPSTTRIIVCYELVDYFVGIFKPHVKSDAELGSSVMGATIFTFYHETGHGLIDQLKLPAVGREEDSVDQLATLILIGEGEKGVQMAMSGAYWFQLTQSGDKTPFWNEHSFDGQRFYNIMCLIYGSNPDKYKDFVNDGTLPAARAARCPDEYRKIQAAWETLLEPHLTNGAAINVDYKPSVPPVEAPKDTKTDPWGDGEAGNSTPTTDPNPEWQKQASQQPVPAITCEQVADHAGDLIAADARGRATTPATKQDVERRLESALPAIRAKLIAQCAKANWEQKGRQCVLDAKDLAGATKCN